MKMNSISNPRTWQIGALSILSAGVFYNLARAQIHPPGRDTFDIRRDATVDAVEQVMPSVVNIATKSIAPVRSVLDQWFPQIPHPQVYGEYYSLGSGVMIDETGYLLTNDHVIRGATEIAVKFNTGSEVFTAKLIASDPQRDIALLKINPPTGGKFHAIKLAREDDLLLGETVLALGNPFGLGGSVTRGILSSKTRSIPKENVKLDIPNWLQTDAPINHGNSGGPLVNLRGELIGINVAVLSEVRGELAQGIGFAVPIRIVEEALADILPTEFVRSFWFGARVKVGSYPLVVASVQADSPAGRAGLLGGDAILQVNGKVPKSFIDFGELLATNAAAEIAMTVRRGPGDKDLKLRLVPAESIFNAEMIRRRLGLSLEPLTAETAARYRVKTGDGFVVTGVMKDSPAEAAHLQNGILIAGINGRSPANLTELAKLLIEQHAGESVRLDIGVLQQVGNFNVLRQGSVELSLR